MKHLNALLLLFFLTFSIAANAQLAKGDISIGGNANLGLNFGNGNAFFGTTLSPSYGIFVNDHLLLGSGVSLLFGTTSSAASGGLSITPYARYYFNPEAARKHWFAGINTGFQFFQSGNSSFTYVASLEGGLTYFLAPNIGLDFGPYYSYYSLDGDANNQIGLRAALRAIIGGDEKSEWRTASGLFNRGTIVLGVSHFNANLNFRNRGNTSTVYVQPNIGIFLSDRWLAGMSVGFGRSHNESSNFKSSSLNITPYGRYYLADPRHLNFFVEADATYSHYSSNSDFFTGRQNRFAFSAGAGANLFITPNVAVEGTFSFEHEIESQNSDLGFDFGIQFFINRKTE